MIARRILVVGFPLALAVVVWFLWPRYETADPTQSLASAPTAATKRVDGRPFPATSPPLEVSDLARELNSPAHDIRADLRVVLDVIDAFRTNFPRDGNPVGTNAEITAALTGANRLRLALIPPQHSAINPAGELCDRWGTPFFFHAESSTRMEVRSAGPDKKMWTDDDVVLAP